MVYPVKKEMPLALKILSGESLDGWGKLFGAPRNAFEEDLRYRERLADFWDAHKEKLAQVNAATARQRLIEYAFRPRGTGIALRGPGMLKTVSVEFIEAKGEWLMGDRTKPVGEKTFQYLSPGMNGEPIEPCAECQSCEKLIYPGDRYFISNVIGTTGIPRCEECEQKHQVDLSAVCRLCGDDFRHSSIRSLRFSDCEKCRLQLKAEAALTKEMDALRNQLDLAQTNLSSEHESRKFEQAAARSFHERNCKLGDENGTLRTENDTLLRENATLRRKIEKLEKKK